MDEKRYDAIVVGARVASAPTAMLLAQPDGAEVWIDAAPSPCLY